MEFVEFDLATAGGGKAVIDAAEIRGVVAYGCGQKDSGCTLLMADRPALIATRPARPTIAVLGDYATITEAIRKAGGLGA